MPITVPDLGLGLGISGDETSAGGSDPTLVNMNRADIDMDEAAVDMDTLFFP